jgi:hypothetical protein
MPGPNLIADSSFESMETRAFTLDPPFKITADPHAHSGNADVHAELSHSGKRIFTRVSVWKSTDFVSKIWIRGSGAESGNTGNFNAVVYPPAGTDYTQWHTYGQLWIPATADNGWHGYRQVYFDGVPQQAICWIGNQTSETSQPSGSYLFSMCDGTPKSPPVVA